jgi:hypothetical protein
MRDTWVKEGTLSTAAIRETKRLFGRPYDYHRVHARLVENLVFQSSLLDWIAVRASDVQLRLHVVGTALLSALVSTGSVSFTAAVESAVKFGSKWDQTLRDMVDVQTDEIERVGFARIRRLLEGRASFSLGVSRSELPSTDAPAQPFWYSPAAAAEPTLITTAQEAANALETLNLASWSSAPRRATANPEEPVRGWLVSPLHPMARICRWSCANHLLATPGCVTVFLDHIATLSRRSAPQTPEPFQNRLRLSRMKVTGP